MSDDRFQYRDYRLLGTVDNCELFVGKRDDGSWQWVVVSWSFNAPESYYENYYTHRMSGTAALERMAVEQCEQAAATLQRQHEQWLAEYAARHLS